MKKKILTAVVGVGYLGKFHAQKYACLPQSHLIAVCDSNFEQSNLIAQPLGVQAIQDYRSLIGTVEAVSIATPTPSHHEIASFFLEHGIHVLLEKPISVTIAEADHLIHLAKQNNLVLQIGHIERFNNTIQAVEPRLKNPRFFDGMRLAPFKLRGSEVNVILDLMIHDIDLILSMVKSPIKKILANGSEILSPQIDIANARIEFVNGCVANITASRIHPKVSRRLHIFQDDVHFNLDLHNKKLTTRYKKPSEDPLGLAQMLQQKQSFPKDDPLKTQIEAFLMAIIDHTPVVVSGEDGKRALQTAIQITELIMQTQQVPVDD